LTSLQLANLGMEIWQKDADEHMVMQSYCNTHTPKWHNDPPFVAARPGGR
jgi:hypothetical protein